MSVTPVLNDEQWMMLIEHAAADYNEVTLSRGFSYFKQQRVAALTISEKRIIRAIVEGTETYQVTLNLDKPRSSRCDCPVGISCKHQAAVMMELGDRLGYSATQLVNAKQQKKTAPAVASAESELKQLPGKDVFGWHDFLDAYTSHIKPSYDQSVYLDMLRYRLQSITPGSIPFTPMDRVYYDLHKELFILRKLQEQLAQGSVNYYTSFALYRMYDGIHAWLKQQSSQIDFTASVGRLKQTLAYVRGQMAKETGHKYLGYGVYTSLWKHWAQGDNPDNARLASEEIDDIGKQTSEPIPVSLSAAKAYLYLRLSRSEDAWSALEATGSLKMAPASLLFLPFLHQIADSRDWESLVDWLMKTAAYFYGQNAKELYAYMNFWKQAVSYIPEAEKGMWDVLEGMLPHSSQMIEDLLYEQRKWKQWVEVQILEVRDPLHHRVQVLQPIEKEAPELLLPFYHQAIDRHVGLKNRQDYKYAVKLLKRLEKVYKRMKKTERWDRFFEGFSERYSRLRALQEELKKGKLME